MTVLQEWLQLPGLRMRYQDTINKLVLLQETEPTETLTQKRLQGQCWELRKSAYRILVKTWDEGYDERSITSHGDAFGWSMEQLRSESLRQWLCS